ncbi:MAG: hypothetical protein NTW28_19455, partial [Candidatus Solibacter sp.]|nr:hypothetical protein [Candidatus Solibacter sp.]
SLTAPPGPAAGMRTWAERQVLVTIHAQAKISAFPARPLQEIHLGTITRVPNNTVPLCTYYGANFCACNRQNAIDS